MYIGKRIKELRQVRGMKLKDLAEKSGVQIATLSRMEHEKMTGTLDSHLEIAKALGVELTQLYQNINVETRLVKPTTVAPTDSFTYNDKSSYEFLTSRILSRRMLPTMLKIEVNGATNEEINPEGSERFIFVLEGEITAIVGEEKFVLPKHHTLYLDASQPHKFANSGKGIARAISVLTPVAL
jgi:transcriptional regulator with XRE-family HTH domain